MRLLHSTSFRRGTIPATAILLSPGSVHAASLQAISDTFSTGVDAGGVPLAEGTNDPHYDFSSVRAGESPPGPIAINSGHGFPIVPGPSHDGVDGNYVYRTTFTIPANIDPSQVFVRGQGKSDNAITDVRLNGVSTGVTFTGNFPAFDPQFLIQSGFQSGLNTLEFTVNEAGGGPIGVRVEFLSSTYVPIPEPSSAGLLAVGLFALLRRRR